LPRRGAHPSPLEPPVSSPPSRLDDPLLVWPRVTNAVCRLRSPAAHLQHSPSALQSNPNLRALGSPLRAETDESPAAWVLMMLFFLHFSLDGGKKTLLASFATVALLPRIAAVRGHIAFKSPVAGSDRGRSHQ
jgi:hypothetical protein